MYSDIEALGALGYDIKLRRGRGGGYFLASRTFDLAELKLLVDAVQASRVVSGTTSRRLIHKLEKLCSNYEGSQLQRQVYVDGRPKTDSKSLLYSIDALHEAINNGKMVEFLYRKADSREKEKRTVSPWQLAWGERVLLPHCLCRRKGHPSLSGGQDEMRRGPGAGCAPAGAGAVCGS